MHIEFNLKVKEESIIKNIHLEKNFILNHQIFLTFLDQDNMMLIIMIKNKILFIHLDLKVLNGMILEYQDQGI